MNELRIRDQEHVAHRQATEFPISDVARYLSETLGRSLVAHLSGIADAKAVNQWASGDRAPNAESDRRLRAAFQIFHLLQNEESAHTVRAWFVGMNPQLNDETPADVIREGRLQDALVAAKAYMAGG